MSGKSAAFANYREGTGVRARSDLSPNPRAERVPVVDLNAPLTREQLFKAAVHLDNRCDEAERAGTDDVRLPVATVRKMARLARDLEHRWAILDERDQREQREAGGRRP